MAEKTLIANIIKDEEKPETLILTSPVVGKADGNLAKGTYLNPFDRILTMMILQERYALRLPRDVQGRITEIYIPNSVTPVAFNEPLIRIDPKSGPSATDGTAGEAGGLDASDDGAVAGTITVKAPSEGIFYRRSSPDVEPYVEVGSQIATGTVLGLVEVMKCFNQIAYGGIGLPEKGEVVKILADDSSEVQFGQPLFHVKPIE